MTVRSKQIILHIGTEKTGTTSIQKMLFENKDILKQKGVYFLQSPGEKNNRKLSVFSMGDNRADDYTLALGIPEYTAKSDFDKAFLKEIREEIQNIPDSVNTVIASSEHLHSRLLFKTELEKLKGLLTEFFSTITIVCYFRRQDDLLNSLYSTILKSGGDQSFNHFFRNYVKPDSVILIYLKSMELWGEVFSDSQFYMRPFNRSSFVDGCLIMDFFSAIEKPELMSFIKLPDQENESIDCVGQALLRLYNRKKNTGEYLSQNRMPVQWINKNRQGSCYRLSRQQVNILNNYFWQANLEFQKKYMEKSCELFTHKFDFRQVINDPVENALIDFFEFITESGCISNVESEQKQVDCIRDAAIFFERKDLDTALQLMGIALRLRPTGALIQKKVSDYMKILEERD